jgi:chromosome segregation ATPase
MTEKKLEKQHVEEINHLRNKFSENSSDIALATKEIYALQQRIDQLETARTQLLQQFESLQSQETDLVNKLKEHYGEGQIDLVKSVFVSES